MFDAAKIKSNFEITLIFINKYMYLLRKDVIATKWF